MRKTAWVLLALWAILCVGALADHLYSVATVEGQDRLLLAELEMKLSLEMLLLNAPISLLVVVTGPVLPGEGPIGEWLWLVFAGFLQWTILVPAAVSRFRRVFAELDEEGEGRG
jgi:hypothetical protein